MSNINNENLYEYKLCYKYCAIHHRKNIYFDTSEIVIKNSMKNGEQYILDNARLAHHKLEETSIQDQSKLIICKYDDLSNDFTPLKF